MTAPAPEADPAPVAPPADPAPTPDPKPTEPPKDELGDAGKNAIAEERKARKDAERKAAELAAKVKEFEDAKLSEQERAAKELAEAQAAAKAAREEAAAAQLDALRHRIAAEKKVPAELLTGTDEASLTASADVALKWHGEKAPAAPRPDPSVGARGDVKLSGAERGKQLWYEINKKKQAPEPAS